MDLDGQAIERRDFPISRRGYEPAAVDAHLRTLSEAVLAMRSQMQRGETIGQAAGAQVQGILDAAESTAAGIVRDAKAHAAATIAAAEAEAANIRKQALGHSEAHLAAVGEAGATLRARLQQMEGQIEALTSGLRAGGSKLTQDLSSLRSEMAALYDSAAGRAAKAAEPKAHHLASEPAEAVTPRGSTPPDELSLAAEDDLTLDDDEANELAPEVAPLARNASQAENGVGQSAGAVDLGLTEDGDSRSSDVDGARLIALNMALNGDSREQTDRYLAEHFELPERSKLVDEVYAAIEG